MQLLLLTFPFLLTLPLTKLSQTHFFSLFSIISFTSFSSLNLLSLNKYIEERFTSIRVESKDNHTLHDNTFNLRVVPFPFLEFFPLLSPCFPNNYSTLLSIADALFFCSCLSLPAFMKILLSNGGDSPPFQKSSVAILLPHWISVSVNHSVGILSWHASKPVNL